MRPAWHLYKDFKMKIVCIAWGSLIWRPGQLALASEWTPGGPHLPLEFARDSDDTDELALVLCDGVQPVPTYWATFETQDIDVAKEQLLEREKISRDHPEWVGSITAQDAARDTVSLTIQRWLVERGVDCAVWTAIPPKFRNENGRVPTADEAIEFLAALRGEAQATAENYVRSIPADIMTPYRLKIGAALRWTPRPGAAY